MTGPNGELVVVVRLTPLLYHGPLVLEAAWVRFWLDQYPTAGAVAIVDTSMMVADVQTVIRQALTAMTPTHVAAAHALPLTDALKQVDHGLVKGTVERSTLRRLALPAVVKVDWLQTLLVPGRPRLRPLATAGTNSSVFVLTSEV